MCLEADAAFTGQVFCQVPFDDSITLNGWTLHYFQLKGFHHILTSKNYSEATSVS